MSKKDRKKDKEKKQKKNQKDNKDEEENILLKDERFQKAVTHPKFSNIKDNNKKINKSSSLLPSSVSSSNNKNHQKTVIDERFSKLLTDENFQTISITKGKGTRVDKYGKKIDKKKESREELSAFYTLEGKGEDEDKDDNDDDDVIQESEEEIEENNDDMNKEEELDMENPEVRIAYLTALSRGEIDDSSSSSEDESGDDSSSSDSGDEEEDFEAVGNTVLNPLDDKDEGNELIFDHASRHLAILNLDWSNMRAMDILVLLSSFAKTPGDVRSISIYPSNFGLEQMKKEDAYGPSGIWKKKSERDDGQNNKDDDVEEENTDDEDIAHKEDDIDPVKLRAYEASKLRYYFAVAEFSSSKALDHVYDELNGEEFEHSSVAIELRLIPTQEDLKDIITDRDVKEKASMPIPSSYNPPDFILDALQYTKVKCTWDEDDLQRRQKLTTAPTNDQDYDDLRAYLASDNSSDEEEQSISSSSDAGPKSSSSDANKFRKLLGLAHSSDESDQENDDGEEAQEQGNKQFTYVPEKKQMLEQKIQEKAISKQKDQEEKELTPWDKYLLKRKEKRRERRQAAKAKRYQNDSDNDSENDSGQEQEETNNNNKTSKEELELLLAGDDKEEQSKDFNMRQLIKLQTTKEKSKKNKNKKAKKDTLTTTSGQEFQINVMIKKNKVKILICVS